MQPTMILKPARRAPRPQRQRLGQAAGLVELDVDRVVFAGEPVEVRARCGRLRRRRPARARHPRQRLVLRRPAAAARSARPRARRSAGITSVRCRSLQPSLASTISRACGALRRTAAHPLEVAVAGQLQLQQRPARGCAAAASPIRSGGVEAQRIGGDQRLAATPSPAMSATRRSSRLASRSQSAQSSALRAAPGGIARCNSCRSSPENTAPLHRLQRLDDALDALAVARIGHAFAAAAELAVGHLGDHHLGGRSWLPREIVKGCASGQARRLTLSRCGCGAMPAQPSRSTIGADPGRTGSTTGRPSSSSVRAQVVARRRRVQRRGVDADPDAAHRRVGQLRRLDVAVDAVLQVGQLVGRQAAHMRRGSARGTSPARRAGRRGSAPASRRRRRRGTASPAPRSGPSGRDRWPGTATRPRPRRNRTPPRRSTRRRRR